MLASAQVFVIVLLLECTVLEVGLCDNGQQVLRNLIAEALDNFTCSVPNNAPSLNEIVEKLESKLPLPSLSRIEEKVNAMSQAITDMLTTLNERTNSLQRQINRLDDNYGLRWCHAADSCADILARRANSPSGYYYVRNAIGHPHRVYCDMTRSCGRVTGGWMRVANLDMTNNSHRCPNGLLQRIRLDTNGCSPYANSATCSSAWYPSHGIEYSRVCGSIQGYFYGSLDGFNDYGRGTSLSIDSNYVDGVSLTHGTPIRNHIWTFAVRWDCPCGPTPAFIGNDYFCNVYKHDDFRWNIGSCSGTNICCNPPGFHRHLPRPTTDDIEMRLCRDQNRTDEDVFVSKVEVYVM